MDLRWLGMRLDRSGREPGLGRRLSLDSGRLDRRSLRLRLKGRRSGLGRSRRRFGGDRLGPRPGMRLSGHWRQVAMSLVARRFLRSLSARLLPGLFIRRQVARGRALSLLINARVAMASSRSA